MRYSGIQPQYFPRLHYFARILQTDTFVIRDDVQFVRKHKYPDGTNGKSYQAHSPIKHPTGLHFLLIPVVHKGYQSIVNSKIQYDSNWIEKHLKTIQTFYGKTPNFSVLYPQIRKLIKKKYSSIAELNIATILWGIIILLDIKIGLDEITIKKINKELQKNKKIRLKKIMRGSENKSLCQNNSLSANEKIITLLKEIGANEDYCGGTAIATYMDKDLFEKNGIKIVIQEWECKNYSQLFSNQSPFIPNLSIIDLLMNLPPKDALEILNIR